MHCKNPNKARANVSLYNLTKNTNVSPANRKKKPNFSALKIVDCKSPILKDIKPKREGKEGKFYHLT